MAIPPGSLIATKPARFPEQAAQEERTYAAILRLWGRIEAFLLNALGLRGSGAHAAEETPWVMGPSEEFRLLQSAQWLCEGILGKATSASEFASPVYAMVSVENPVWEGIPILPGEMRTAYSIGITRAVQESGIGQAALVGTKQAMAQDELSRIAFARLTQGARDRIGHVLYKPGYPGGVRDALQDAMARGESPLKVARELRDRFGDIRDYNWARLARTEIAFAQNGAMIAEYEQEGFRRAVGGLLPPYHPNCVCGTTILPQQGWIIPDVARTACEVCQRHLAEYLTIVRGVPVEPRAPVLPPVQRIAEGPEGRKSKQR